MPKLSFNPKAISVGKPLSTYVIPKEETPRDREEAILSTEPNLMVDSILSLALCEIFNDFFSKSGKYRKYADLVSNHRRYYSDVEMNDKGVPVKTGLAKINFRVYNRSISKLVPSIQINLGTPIQVTDVNRGYEHTVFSFAQRKLISRTLYNVASSVLITAHDEQTLTDYVTMFNAIVLRYLQSITSGDVINDAAGWRVEFPKRLESSDMISSRPEIQAIVTEMKYVEYSMPLIFECIDIYSNSPEINIGSIEFGNPEPPFLAVEKTEISIGETCRVEVGGNKNINCDMVSISDPSKAMIQRVGSRDYVIIGKAIGDFKVQMIIGNHTAHSIDIKIR